MVVERVWVRRIDGRMDKDVHHTIDTIAAAFPLDGKLAVEGALSAQAGLYACIPACDEERLIGRCLVALDGSLQDGDGVILLANGCRDATAPAALTIMRGWTRPWLLLRCNWRAGLGTAPLARRLAMDIAHALNPEALLVSTDGDTVAGEGLARAYRAAFARGADLVCGGIDFLADEAALMPQADPHDEFLLREYRAVSREIAQMLFPDTDNVWPHHGNIGGANFAISGKAYSRVGGLPTPSSGEDRALRRMVLGLGLRVLYVDTARVATSPRLDGRARGGLADELRRSRTETDPIVDEALEAPETLYRRTCALRDFLAAGDVASRRSILAGLGIEDDRLEDLAEQGGRHAFHLAEDASPFLARWPLRLSDLARHLPNLMALRAAIAEDRVETPRQSGAQRGADRDRKAR